MGGYSNKRKPVQDGKNQYKRFKGNAQGLPVGSRGFLVTTVTNKDRFAAAEIMTVLEEYYEKLGGVRPSAATGSGEEAAAQTGAPPPEGGSGGLGADVSQQLAQEVKELKSAKQLLFKKVEVGIQNLLYIQMIPEGSPTPLQIATHIMEHVEQSRELRTRNCIRLIPIEHTCEASLETLREKAKEARAAQFPDEGPGKSFAVEYTHRGIRMKRQEVIDAFADVIPKPPHRVDLNNPDVTILVEVVHHSIGIAIVPKYMRLQKFNMMKLQEEGPRPAVPSKASAASQKSSKVDENGGTSVIQATEKLSTTNGKVDDDAPVGSKVGGEGEPATVNQGGSIAGQDTKDVSENGATMEKPDETLKATDGSDGGQKTLAGGRVGD